MIRRIEDFKKLPITDGKVLCPLDGEKVGVLEVCGGTESFNGDGCMYAEGKIGDLALCSEGCFPKTVFIFKNDNQVMVAKVKTSETEPEYIRKDVVEQMLKDIGDRTVDEYVEKMREKGVFV